jgi:hypothetical protein
MPGGGKYPYTKAGITQYIKDLKKKRKKKKKKVGEQDIPPNFEPGNGPIPPPSGDGGTP